MFQGTRTFETFETFEAAMLAEEPADPAMPPSRCDIWARSSGPDRGVFQSAAAAPATPPRIDPTTNAALCR